jgi:hypothetical protein
MSIRGTTMMAMFYTALAVLISLGVLKTLRCPATGAENGRRLVLQESCAGSLLSRN